MNEFAWQKFQRPCIWPPLIAQRGFICMYCKVCASTQRGKGLKIFLMSWNMQETRKSSASGFGSNIYTGKSMIIHSLVPSIWSPLCLYLLQTVQCEMILYNANLSRTIDKDFLDPCIQRVKRVRYATNVRQQRIALEGQYFHSTAQCKFLPI